MYNSYNPYSNPLERIDNQIKELEGLKKSYQNIPQQPIQNIINTNGSQIEFEARILNDNEKPDEILVARRTAFIDLKNGLLSIKEINGDIKEYKIEIPKTQEQIENELLKDKIKELEEKINGFTNINQSCTTNEENEKPTKCTNTRTTKDSK